MRTSYRNAALGILSLTLGLTFQASAQSLAYSQDFDTDTSADWVVNMVGNSNRVDFHFDYASVGIPAAPRSSGGSTYGLKLQANMAAVDPATGAAVPGVFPGGVSVSPLGFSITENFEMRFDMWINFNGPMPGGGSGSTLVGGAGYGTAGTAAQVAGNLVDSIYIGATGDGGSSADFRVYAPNKSASYQDADHVIGSDTNSPFVYAAAARNNSATYYATNFLGATVPAAQVALYPKQTGTTANGSVGMKWRDVSLKKVGNTITYRIDGVLIATVDATEAGVLGGANILFNTFDINAATSTDTNAPAMAFTLIDNVRITNFPNVVSVSATQPLASEAGPQPGVFTITRTSAGVSQTVSYTMSGTAVNGTDYQALSGTVTFSAAATSVDVTVNPLDDSVSELTETVVLTINESPNYVGAGSATVSISDNDAPVLKIEAVSATTYERNPFDRARVRIQRYGDLNFGEALILDASSFVTTGLGGTASASDFTLAGLPAQIDPGVGSILLDLVSPVDNAAVTGPKTIVVGLKAGANFGVTTDTATITLVDDDYPAAGSLLYSDALAGDSSARWKTAFAANNGLADYRVNWGFTLAEDVIPNAPNGSTTALKLTVNKDEGSDNGAAGLNLYLQGVQLTKSYSVRFNMYMTTSSGGTTEFALMGVNHSGSMTNWLIQSGAGDVSNAGSDGFWFAASGDGSGSAPGDFVLFRGAGAGAVSVQLASASGASMAGVLKSPPFEFAGGLDNAVGTETPSWVDVDIRRVGNTVALRINNTPVVTYNNATNYTTGTVMIGYMDPYVSIGGGGAAYFSNLRVVDLTPSITGITRVGNANQIEFATGDLGDTAASFAVQTSATVNGGFADDATATIEQVKPGSFRATINVAGNTQFYRIRHQ